MPNRRRSSPTIFASLILLLVLGLAACSSSGDGPLEKESDADRDSGSEEEEQEPNTVSMVLIKFKPDNLQVTAGTEVTWVQNDAGFHSIVSGTIEDKAGGVTQNPDGKFKSEGISTSAEDCKCELATDEEFSFTFDEPGTYPYYCSIHPATMRGEVRVR